MWMHVESNVEIKAHASQRLAFLDRIAGFHTGYIERYLINFK